MIFQYLFFILLGIYILSYYFLQNVKKRTIGRTRYAVNPVTRNDIAIDTDTGGGNIRTGSHNNVLTITYEQRNNRNQFLAYENRL